MKDFKDSGRYSFLIDTNNYILGQLNFAETKHGVLITLNTALSGAIITLLLSHCIPLWLVVYLVIWLVLLQISSSISLLSFFPDLSKNGKEQNFFNYNDIGKMDIKDYKFKDDKVEKDIKNQNIVLGKITTRKMLMFRKSLRYGYILFPTYIIIVVIKKLRK